MADAKGGNRLNLLGRIRSGLNAFRGEPNQTEKRGYLPMAYPNYFGWGLKTDSGVEVNSETAMTLSAYFAAVRNISEDIGKIPFSIYQEITGVSRSEQRQNPAWWLIYMSSSPGVPSYVLKQSLITSALNKGDGFAYIERDQYQRPKALLFVPYENVTVLINEANELGYQIRNSQGFMNVPAGIYPATDMIHLRGMTLNGITGVSVISYAANAIGGAIAAQKLGNDTFKNGSNVGGTLEHPGNIGPEGIAMLENSFNAAMQGQQGSQRWKVLEEGMKANPMTIKLEDYQLIETKKFNVQDVARWLRIPIHKIGDMSGSTFSNVEHQSIEYVTDTLMPWVTKLEDEFTLKILTYQQRQDNIFVYAHTNELTRGDMAARAAYYKEMIYVGAITPNEVRWEEWYNSMPGGDIRLIPANMAIIETDGKIHPPTDPNQPTPTNG